MTNDWYEDAKEAIELCRAWALESQKIKQLAICNFFLFGSAIYLDGEQFDPLRSDLDIVCVMPDGLSVIERVELLSELRTRKLTLELDMIPQLQRDVCDEPGVSVVALTPFEVETNIHKSGARSFFDKNYFYDLINEELRTGLLNAGDRTLPDARRQALEFCQKQRNEYLGGSANATGGLATYRGIDPIPKATLRSAAQLAPSVPAGGWYDTRHGLEYLFQELNERRLQHAQYQCLYKKISVRRGGKGRREDLTADEQLLLAEVLHDLASKGGTEDVVLWEVRVSTPRGLEDAQIILAAIQRIVPDARLRSQRSGSVVLTLQSSEKGYELFLRLHSLNVLKEALDLDVLSVSVVRDSAVEQLSSADGRLGQLVEYLTAWSPNIGVIKLSEFMIEHVLRDDLLERGKKDSFLTGCIIQTDSRLESGTTRVDLSLYWKATERLQSESIGIEILTPTSYERMLARMARYSEVSMPLIFLVFGSVQILEALKANTPNIRKMNANWHVVARNERDIFKAVDGGWS